MLKLKLTPLTRLTMAFDAELNLMAAPQKEEVLASKYLERVHDATVRRDSTLKGIFILDALLAIATSGKNVSIPGVGISMADVPALMEVLIGMVSIAAYICSQSFMNCLCYSQIHQVFSNRIAKRYEVDPDMLELAAITSEPTLKMLRAKLNIWGPDWHTPTKPFRLVAKLYDIGNNLFFLMLPLLHCLLMFHAVMRVVSTSDIGVTHVVFFAWVTVAHMLALLVWVVPMLGFTFTIESTSTDITNRVPEGAE
jgi:hypothetical protein